jgi:UDP-3-O-[3-hydroxymyristoyl] glucosamine N-acyltransferase
MRSEGRLRSLAEIAKAIEATLVGDGAVKVGRVASIASAEPGDLVFVDDPKHLDSALQSPASAVIAGAFAPAHDCKRPLLINNHPKLAFARAARVLQQDLDSAAFGIDSSAVIHPTVLLASNICIAPQAVIGPHAEIGERTHIGAGCAIGEGVRIGHDCQIYPNVTVYSGTTIGDRVIVHAGAVLGSDGFGYVREPKTGHYEKFPQVGRLVIENEVEIGANATIDRGALDETRIRRGAKIDNLVHIGHNCQIGEDVVIAAQTGLSGSIVIENGAVLGGQVGIGEHARIGEGVMIGGQGGVLPNKVLRGKGIAFWGTPAQPLRAYLKQLAILARLAKKDKPGQ